MKQMDDKYLKELEDRQKILKDREIQNMIFNKQIVNNKPPKEKEVVVMQEHSEFVKLPKIFS